MRWRCERVGPILAVAAVGLVGLANVVAAAEEAPSPTPTPGGFVYWLENPGTENLPFRLTGEADLGGVKLEGDRNSVNFRTYSVIQEGFLASRFRLGLETQDQRWYMNFQGLDIGKDDQNYRASVGQYGRYRLDFEYDGIPHLYGRAESPYVYSGGGMYTLPASLIGAGNTLAHREAAFNDSNIFDVKTLNDNIRTGFWWTPGPEWDLQVGYEHTRRAGTRPMGAGFGPGGGPAEAIVEMQEPIDWQIDQANATLGYSTPLWQLQAGSSVSIFRNDIPTMTFTNPFYTGVGCGAATVSLACTPQGRTVLAPDNQAYNWFVTGGLNLPMATRITTKVSYGMNRQDDTFFAPTINGVLLGTTPSLSSAYYAPSLGGDLRTLLINATATSRPIQDVTVTATYRDYATDNHTLAQSIPAIVERDDAVSGEGGRYAFPYDYQKQNADLDVTYRILRPLTLRAGVGWEQWNRPDPREVTQTDEYGGKFGVTYRPLSWLDIAARYTPSWKRINDYDPYAPLVSYWNPSLAGYYIGGQRKYDEAPRDRQKAELTFRFTPLESLEVGLALAYTQDIYPFTYYGLLSDKNWNGTVDVAYTPLSWLTLHAAYTLEEDHAKQRENSEVAPAPINLQPNEFDWVSNNVDTTNTVILGTIFRLIPSKLELTADYQFELSLSSLHTFSPGPTVPPTADLGVDFPTDRMARHRIVTALRYWVLKNLSLRAGYTYERFRESYWQADFVQPITTNVPSLATTNVFLGLNPYQNYGVHIISAGVIYKF